MRRDLFALVAVASSIACARTVVPAADGFASRDARDASTSMVDVARDVARPFPCTNVRECALYDRPTNVVFSNGADCVAQSCVWAPVGGATCFERANGCIDCDTSLGSACPSDACSAMLGRPPMRIESANCARDFVRAIAACYGNFVRLDDGTVCVIIEAPTDALRYVLSCGACETVFMP
jgi:hypothetical protein